MIHYLAISKDVIIHGDINISNLMCRRLEDGSVQGVLNNWDVASTSHTESDSEHTNMRTPFISKDLNTNHYFMFYTGSVFRTRMGNSFLRRRGIVLSSVGLGGTPMITMMFALLKLVY